MTGIDLKVRRVAADVRLKDLAAVMGVSDSRVSRIEGSRQVTDDAAERYLRALATFGTVSAADDARGAA